MAEKFLGEQTSAEGGFFGFELLGLEARAFGGGDDDATPVLLSFGEFGEIEAVHIFRRGEEPDGAVLLGKHRTDGGVDAIFDHGRFVDDEHCDAGKAANCVRRIAGNGDEAGAVGEDEGVAIDGVAGGGEAEPPSQFLDFAQEFGGLAEGGAGDDAEGFGEVVGMKEERDGGHPTFAPLARAIEDDAAVGAGEQFALFFLELPTEQRFSEGRPWLGWRIYWAPAPLWWGIDSVR